MVSVVMPTYNRAFIVKTAIESVLKQTYKHWELIIVDDCSTDNTSEVIHEYMKRDSRIKYIQQKDNVGANACRNLGIKTSVGEYIALLDSDNEWNPQKLEKQIELFKKAKENVAVVFCREKIINGESVTLLPTENFDVADIKSILCQRNVIDSSTSLIKKESFYKIGFFDETLPRWQEWEFFIRLLVRQNYDALFVDEVLNVSWIQTDSISRNSRKLFVAAQEFLKRYPDCFEDNEKFLDIILNEMSRSRESWSDAIELMIQNPVTWKFVLSRMYDKVHKKPNNQISLRDENELLYLWKMKSSQNKNISILESYFRKEDSKVAIYGLGKWGRLLYEDVVNSSLQIVCGIDQNVKDFYGMTVLTPEDELRDVDCVIVSVINDSQIIVEQLQNRYNCKVVSIKDIIKTV